jgi:hypothetical protein
MAKQKPFEFRDIKTDAEYLQFDEKFRGSDVLEYTLLLGHVLIEDQLRGLIWARLGTDTLPDLRGFELVAGLAFAGSEYEDARDKLANLNEARNQVGHKLHRTDFDLKLRTFVASVIGQGKSATEIEWPDDEPERAAKLRLAIRFFMVWVALKTDYYAERNNLGVEAWKVQHPVRQ